MIPKNYIYKDTDGDHWPDAAFGNNEYYCIDFSDWITEENDSFVSAEWTIPIGLFGSDDYVIEEDNQAFIKLRADGRGSFKVNLALTTMEENKESTKQIVMILRVY